MCSWVPKPSWDSWLSFFFFLVDQLLLGMTELAWGFKWARAAMVAVSDPGIVP